MSAKGCARAREGGARRAATHDAPDVARPIGSLVRLARSFEGSFETPPIPPAPAPPAEYQLAKRKEFEDQARRVGRWNGTIWVKVRAAGGSIGGSARGAPRRRRTEEARAA